MSSSNAVFRRSAAVLAFGLSALGAMGVASAQDASATATAAPASGGIAGTDHAKVVNHMGFTYLGVQGIQIASDVNGGRQGIAAPTVGVRYWLNEGMAIDAGLGIAFRSGSTESKQAATTTTTDDPSAFGAVVHIGVPIVLGTPGKHYKFLVIPEANIGYGSSTIKAVAVPNTPSAPDIELSGLFINAGARVGAEIQFGFIGIPELALQGSVGLALARTSTTGKQGAGNGGADRETTKTDLGIATNLQNNPWGIFTNSVAAIYYF